MFDLDWKSVGSSMLDWKSLSSMVATIIFIRSLIREFMPPEVTQFLKLLSIKVFSSVRTNISILIDEYDSNYSNELFDSIQAYLSSKCFSTVQFLKLSKPKNSKNLTFTMESNQKVHDNFQGIPLKWTLCTYEKKSSGYGYGPGRSYETHHFKLSFHKKHKQMIHSLYLPYVIEEATRIKFKNRERRIYSNSSKKTRIRREREINSTRRDSVGNMQRLCRRGIFSKDSFVWKWRQQQFFSQVAATEADCNVSLPKMPPFDYSPPPYDGPSASEIFKKRKEFLSPSMFHFYHTPLNVVDGKKQYLFDENGRRFLDAFGGIATVCCGHCHPEVVEAIVNQTKRLQHSTIVYLNHNVAEFAEALASKLPGDLKVVFFTNSGTEANELAMMIARLYTGCHDIVSLRNGYHGNAAGTMGMTAQSNWKFNVVQSGVHHAMNPDPYRGAFGSDGLKYAKDVQDLIDYGTWGRVAGFISEAIQGVGGIVELAPGYLPAAYKNIKKAGGLCIADEVQSGFARTGSHFWGFEAHGVVPDIVTMAKGIGNGIPLGAVVTTPEIAQVLTHRSYFNTFGGNPVCTAAGHAVLKVLEKEKLQENAHVVGSYLIDRLKSLQAKHEIIGDVRGRGLMIGVELVTDRQLKTPAKAETVHVMDQMKEMGVLIGKGGFFGNVFRITPPLCFNKEDADFLVYVMDYTMSKM